MAPWYVMQEHRQLIKRASTSSGDQLDKQTQILKCFGIVAQVFNEPFMKVHFCLVLDLEPLSSHPLVDSRHLIDLMLVDRMFKSRFDSLESERENGYRHSHCAL